MGSRTLQVFLNIVLDEAVEEKAGGEKVRIGMVVWRFPRRIFSMKIGFAKARWLTEQWGIRS